MSETQSLHAQLVLVQQRLSSAGLEDAAHWAALIADEISRLPRDAQAHALEELVRLAAQGAPLLAYKLGRQRFMGLDLIAEPGVIVPRPVTERVGRAALRLLQAHKSTQPTRELRVIDMCSGSGNLACAIAHHEPLCWVWSCDLTPAASDLARRNAERLGLSERVAVRTGDLFGALANDDLLGSIDLVLCAPPFISTGRLAKDRAHLLEHEPREAFDAGPYGLTIHQRTASEAVGFLKPGGHLVFEVGEGQSKQVSMVLKRARSYDEAQVIDENDGTAFVVQARRQSAAG